MEKYISMPGNKAANIVKWKIKKHSAFSSGTILCLYKLNGEDEIQKLKATEIGTVVDILQEEGTDITAGCHILKVQGCQHPIVMKDMCAECGADLREALGVAGDRRDSVSASVAMVHSVPELIVSEQQAVELGKEDEVRLISSRKLVLLVDLDETLLHTTNDTVPVNLKDVYHFQLWHGPSLLWYHTKFRPGTKKFLDSISKLYELHICTFGARMYAHTMARYLDPEGKYFSHRILSRDECFDARSKTANLKSLFPCGDGMVCIIDDREEVWNFVPNLIQVKPYIFFDGTADINAPPGMDKAGKGGKGQDSKPRRNVKVTKVPKGTKSDDGKKLEEENMKGGSIDTESSADGDLERQKVADAMEQDDSGDICQNANDYVETKVQGNSLNSGEGSKDQEAAPAGVVTSMESGEVVGSQDKEKQCHRHQSLTDIPAADEDKEEASVEMMVDDSSTKKQVKVEEEKECIDISEIDDQKEGMQVGKKEEEVYGMVIVEGSKEEVKSESGTTSATEKRGEGSKDQAGSGDSNSGSNDDARTSKTMKLDKEAEVFEEVIEWEDTDDYLLHLEDILTRIHTVYYDMADKVKNTTATVATTSVPADLKKIIPYVKKKVLQGKHLVFSSVVPTNQPLEKSRAFQIAKSLGAEVQREVIPRVGDTKDHTTHLVAAKLGTQKVKAAVKLKGIHIVTPDWLWNCNERWEHVDERLFLLDEKNQPKDGYDSPGVAITSERKKRKAEDVDTDSSGRVYDPETGKRTFKKAKSAVDENKNNDIIRSADSMVVSPGETMPEEEEEKNMDVGETEKQGPCGISGISSRRFSETINPLYTFSRQDREDMDKEVDDLLLGDESDSQDSSNVVTTTDMVKKPQKPVSTSSTPELENDSDDGDSDEKALELRRKVLGQSAESSSEDSMSGDFPKGWKKKRTSLKTEYDDNSHLFQIDDPGEANLALLKAAQSSPHYLFDESDSDADGESIGSADEEMAAALENILYK